MNPLVSKQSVRHWAQALQQATRPAYIAIADLIEQDVRSGRLASNDRLPPLRELADFLGLNYSTVARAYAEAGKRGLVHGQAGAGTLVKGTVPALPLRGGTGAEMTMNMPPEPTEAALVAEMRASAGRFTTSADWFDLLRYQDFGGTAREKEAAATWLRRRLPDVDVRNILVGPGAHSVLAALISLLARPGESICVESLTYPGIKAMASQLGVKLIPLPLDDDGPSGEAFELACKHHAPKALCTNPTLLNPTTQTMSRARREAIADIALHYSIPIIEDDAYAMLVEDAPPPLATLAPGLTYYVTGFSKVLGAGLRTAYVASPDERRSQRLAGALRATTVMSSPVTSALVTRWVEEGLAERVLWAIRRMSQTRQECARRLLAGHPFLAHPSGFHLWLPLPPAWSAVEFASYLRMSGVGAVASVAFATDTAPPSAVRICLGGPMSDEECAAALALVAATIEHPEHPHATVRRM